MRDRPHPNHKLEWPGGVVPEWARPKGNANKRFGKGGAKRERNGGSSPSKRERLQKVMAQSGHGSRRNIEILIAQGHITINGEVAKLGDAVGPGDKVKLDGNLIHLRFGDPLPRVLLYHKPEGEIVSRDDPEKRATVFDKLPKVNGGRWVSVGRLDLNTGGLLIFTTSGELAQRLTHPRFEVEREYAVRVMGEVTEEHRKLLLETGVDIDGDNCKFDSLEDRGGEGSNHWYHVVLREGKNREVRRMMEAAGLMVSRLMRVRFGSVELPGFLKRGMMREMEEEQIQELLNFAGMNEPPPREDGAPDEDDALENIGNRIDRNPQPRQREIDDDIGNKVHAREVAARPEPDGNRGVYGPGAEPVARGPRAGKPGRGPREPGAGGKPFFKKRGAQGGQPFQGRGERDGNVMPSSDTRGDNYGNVAPRQGGPRPPQGPGGRPGAGPGARHGQGPRKHRKHGQGNPQGGPRERDGNVAPREGNAHVPREGNIGAPREGNAPPPREGNPQGQPRQRGPKPFVQGQAPGPNGPKPGRNRRNKNRNRNRGAQDGAGGGEARAQGGEAQPAGNKNHEPV